MIKRIIMVLLAMLVFGTVECWAAPKRKKKSSSVQKGRRQTKAQKKKIVQSADVLRKEFKKIHDMQREMMMRSKEPERVKELQADINSIMKGLAPHLKSAGNIPGTQSMADISQLVKEGKKLVKDNEGYSDFHVLDSLQKRQLEAIAAFRQKGAE